MSIENPPSWPSGYIYNKHPFLKEYYSFLWEITIANMVGQWNNGVIIRHPRTPWLVIKISKWKWADDLVKELDNHDIITGIIDE